MRCYISTSDYFCVGRSKKWNNVLVGEWDGEDDEKCRNSVSKVVPVDLAHVTNHECTNNHESTAGSPGGDASKDGCKEDRD
jgi:hypothetical protein